MRSIEKQLGFNTVVQHGSSLIVDSFAGGGGASEGIRMALGREPDIAINHDKKAIAMHAANHPQTTHYPHSVLDVNPLTATGGSPVGFAWFSPDCKHFSKAKGGKPKDKNIRGLAWVVIRWVNAVSPECIMLENVEEFQKWCPLDSNNDPSPWRPGWFFRCFVGALRRRGYKVDTRELRACDYGAPTIRKRLFLIARRDGRDIVWPEPTHGDPKSAEVRSGKLKPWRTAAECIDWSLPCPSIFLSKEVGRELGVKRPLAENTMRRIAKGIFKYVLGDRDPFIVTCNHSGDGFRGQSLRNPLSTITASRDANGLVVPHLTKFRGQSKGASIKDPMPTITAGGDCKRPAGAAHALGVVAAHVQRDFGESVGSGAGEPIGTVMPNGGGKSALVYGFLAKHYGGVVGSSLDEPVHTVTSKDHNALVAGNLINLKGQCHGNDPKKPLHTQTAGGNHFAQVQSFLVKYYGSEKGGHEVELPLGTVTTKSRFGLVQLAGEDYAIVDIGMRMLNPRELYRAQGFPENYIIGNEGGFLRLTQSEQVRMCGNSVSPVLACALAKANVPYLAAVETRKAAS